MRRLNRMVYDLSADEIHAIRMARGVETQRATGLKYSLSQVTVCKIQRGASRRDVPFTPAERAKSALWLVAAGGRGGKGTVGRPVKFENGVPGPDITKRD